MNVVPDKRQLIELAHYRMPFGKFKEGIWWNLPEPYLIWFSNKWNFQREPEICSIHVGKLKLTGLEGLI